MVVFVTSAGMVYYLISDPPEGMSPNEGGALYFFGGLAICSAVAFWIFEEREKDRIRKRHNRRGKRDD